MKILVDNETLIGRKMINISLDNQTNSTLDLFDTMLNVLIVLGYTQEEVESCLIEKCLQRGLIQPEDEEDSL